MSWKRGTAIVLGLFFGAWPMMAMSCVMSGSHSPIGFAVAQTIVSANVTTVTQFDEERLFVVIQLDDAEYLRGSGPASFEVTADRITREDILGGTKPNGARALVPLGRPETSRIEAYGGLWFGALREDAPWVLREPCADDTPLLYYEHDPEFFTAIESALSGPEPNKDLLCLPVRSPKYMRQFGNVVILEDC